MSVSLEPAVPAQEEPAAIEETEEAPEEPPAPETIIQEPNTSEEANIQAAATPAPKKRGRPKKDPAAKAKAVAPQKAIRMKPPQPLTPESSDVDDEPLDRDDMGTLLLDYLIKRKQTQQDVRRTMWAQLAGLR